MATFTEEICAEYKKYGYAQYKMSKFEEYDLYVKNKDFLISDNIITFTDLSGKLMALKPDVTLSIIKNSADNTESVSKVFYDENVYRVEKGSVNFKEIKQVGLECFGAVDDYCILEVLKLACETLAKISPDYKLDVSNISVVTEILDSCDVSTKVRNEILKFMGQKNIHELQSVCAINGIDKEITNILCQLTGIYGPIDEVFDELDDLLPDNEGILQLESLLSALDNKNIQIDFSVVNDVHYYNGIVFNGFVKGVADSVLSGGQYDNLMTRLKREAKAIGFALYVNMLEDFMYEDSDFDVDVVLVYGDDVPLDEILEKVEELKAEGKTVMAQPAIPEGIRAKEVITYA